MSDDSNPKATEVVAETETTQVTQTIATNVKQTVFGRLAETLDAGVVTAFFVLLLIGFAIWAAFASRSSILAQLQEQAYARGLITFIFTLGTLGIALTLVGSALFSSADDNKFRRAREVFSVLAGVLGTIVGFYFGSTGNEGPRPTLAPVRIVEAGDALQLSAFVNGGTPPYEYDIDLNGTSLKSDETSKDGWIAERLGKAPELKGELRVKDAKGQAVETEFTYPTSASPPPSTPPTTQTAATH